MPTFSFNDSVEAQSFDPLNYRLAIASHSGQIQMFTVDTCGKVLSNIASLYADDNQFH